jgi:hypothetical protein
MRRSGITLVRLSRRMPGLMLVLGVLVLTNACIVTAAAGDQAIDEATCGVGLPVLKSAMSTLASARLEPTSCVLHHLESCPWPATVGPPSHLARHVVLTGNRLQDNLHPFVQVFLALARF